MKPIIGIIGRVGKNNKYYIKTNDEYRVAVVNSGGIPIMIMPLYKESIDKIKPFSNNDPKLEFNEIINICDGFIFPGGDKWYGYEYSLYLEILKQNKPILGICLGMQMMANLHNCSDLTKKILNHNSNENYVHSIFLKDSILKKILKINELKVNSRHNSAITKCDNLLISSYSSDNIIESIEMPNNLFVIGVQWHPESLYNKDTYNKKIFDTFIQACKFDRKK